jgi:hypothetical protein
MKKSITTQTCLLSALALGLALSASAQAVQGSPATSQDPSAADPGPGLVGTNYSELSFGYQRQSGAPKDLRDYEFLSNANVFNNASLGVDANFTYDYLNGRANGFSDRREELQLGLTGFLKETWGKPFLGADAGMAWQDAAGVSRKSLAYTVTGGVEFQVLKDLALTPFIEYQAEPHLYNRGLPAANFPNHVLDYGVKATYRITREWSASLSADLDQHSVKDWGLRAGVSYRF